MSTVIRLASLTAHTDPIKVLLEGILRGIHAVIICQDWIEWKEQPVMDILSLVVGGHLRSCHRVCNSVATRGKVIKIDEEYILEIATKSAESIVKTGLQTRLPRILSSPDAHISVLYSHPIVIYEAIASHHV